MYHHSIFMYYLRCTGPDLGSPPDLRRRGSLPWSDLSMNVHRRKGTCSVFGTAQVLKVCCTQWAELHRPRAVQILTRELESVGIRLNREPPNVFFKRKKTGGVSFSSIGPLTHLDENLVWRILQVCHEADY